MIICPWADPAVQDADLAGPADRADSGADPADSDTDREDLGLLRRQEEDFGFLRHQEDIGAPQAALGAAGSSLRFLQRLDVL